MGLFIKVLILTVLWLILREIFSIFDLIVGLVISFACLWYSRKFIPQKPMRGVSFVWLVFFVFYLIGQMYIAGVQVIKMIFTGASARITITKTCIQNETLRVILADAISLTPGSVFLELEGDNLAILWLDDGTVSECNDIGYMLKGSLEKRLLAAQQGADR